MLPGFTAKEFTLPPSVSIWPRDFSMGMAGDGDDGDDGDDSDGF